jgi:hypothetical protein
MRAILRRRVLNPWTRTLNLGYETLGSQVITFVEGIFAVDMEDAGVAIEVGGVDLDLIQDRAQSAQTMFRLLQGDTANQAMLLITETEQVFREVASILPSDSCNEGTLFRLRDICIVFHF